MRNINIYEYKEKQKRLPVTVIVGDSLVKDIKRWELSDECRKVVTKNFNYLWPTKSRNPENVVFHFATNNVKKENKANKIRNDITEVAL